MGVMHTILGFSFATTLMIANATSVAWLLCYYLLLKPAVSMLLHPGLTLRYPPQPVVWSGSPHSHLQWPESGGVRVQTGAQHRSKSEEELVTADSAVCQELGVAPEKAPILEDSQPPLAGLASDELTLLLFSYVFMFKTAPALSSLPVWRCVSCLDICADRGVKH